MKLSIRSRYIIFIGLLHIVLIFLVFKWLHENKLYFIASEVLIIISVIFSISIYRDFSRPIEFIRSGIEAIKDKDFTIKFVKTGKNEVDVLIDVYNLMIDQLREERTKLNEQHFFLEKLIDASPIAILVMDFDEKISAVNPKAQQRFQLHDTDWLGKGLNELENPLLRNLSDIRDGEAITLKVNSVETYKVQRSHFMDKGFKRSFLMIEELTTDILESEKRAYGKIIRMMAHEVNNTLGATDSILQTTQSYFVSDDLADLREALGIASDRNKKLAAFMRNFADVVRLPPPFREPTNVTGLLRNVALFMRSLAEQKGIIIEEQWVGADSAVFMLDAGQMEQVFVNILKNAIEACQAGDTIKISSAGNQVLITNNGAPIPEHVAEQLFNPFFSTKKDGQGIGLTLTKEILLNHGCSFTLKTDAEGWTVFKIDLA